MRRIKVTPEGKIKADEKDLQELATENYNGIIQEIEVQEIETITIPTYKLKRVKGV